MYMIRVKTYDYNMYTFFFGTLEEAKKLAEYWRGMCAKVEIFSLFHKTPYKIKF